MRVLERLFGPAPVDVRWVPQEEGMGCAVACLAMVMDVSYWEARNFFPHFDPAEGLCSSDVLRVLGEYGWAYASKYQHYSPEKRDRRKWPVAPFAPLHLCAVMSTGWHAVLMLADGTVVDPLQNPWQKRTLRDYTRTYEVHGLWRVR